MSTREEILEIYNAGPEAVITTIKILENAVKEKDIIIAELKKQITISDDRELLYAKLSVQLDRVESELKLLKQMDQEGNNLTTD